LILLAATIAKRTDAVTKPRNETPSAMNNKVVMMFNFIINLYAILPYQRVGRVGLIA